MAFKIIFGHNLEFLWAFYVKRAVVFCKGSATTDVPSNGHEMRSCFVGEFLFWLYIACAALRDAQVLADPFLLICC